MTWTRKLNLYSWIMFVALLGHMNNSPAKPVKEKAIHHKVAHMRKPIPEQLI